MSSNSTIASISEDGLLTTLERGDVILVARNEGILTSYAVQILIPNDADGDGMTDEFEIAGALGQISWHIPPSKLFQNDSIDYRFMI